MKYSRIVAGLALFLAGVLYVLTQRLGCGQGGGGAGQIAIQGGGDAVPSQPPASSGRQPEEPKPLQITIDDTKYFVGDLPVDSVEALVKMAVAVPKDVPPPRVVVLRQPTARYVAEKKLIDALEAAKIDYAKK
jgi:hypothetical protein